MTRTPMGKGSNKRNGGLQYSNWQARANYDTMLFHSYAIFIFHNSIRNASYSLSSLDADKNWAASTNQPFVFHIHQYSIFINPPPTTFSAWTHPCSSWFWSQLYHTPQIQRDFLQRVLQWSDTLWWRQKPVYSRPPNGLNLA